jgi:hypothetical protein
MIKIISNILLLLTVNFTYAESVLTFDENINNAEVIFMGQLIERYEQMESIILKNGESVDKVYTTHVFNIVELLKGQLKNETISVKLSGGYDSVLKINGKYNKNAYHYYREPLETALLFLSYDKLNNFYYSTYDNKSAFLIHGSIEVITDTGWVPIFAPTSKEKTDEDTVTLDILRSKIGVSNE